MGAAVALIIWLAVAVFMIAGVWRVFEKAGEPGWAALIPFYNAYVLCKIAGRPGARWLLLLIPWVGIVIMVVFMMDLAERFGRSRRFGVGLAFLGPIFFPILGFGPAQYGGGTSGGGGGPQQMGTQSPWVQPGMQVATQSPWSQLAAQPMQTQQPSWAQPAAQPAQPAQPPWAQTQPGPQTATQAPWAQPAQPAQPSWAQPSVQPPTVRPAGPAIDTSALAGNPPGRYRSPDGRYVVAWNGTGVDEIVPA